MDLCLWACLGIMFIIIILLIAKIKLLQKAAREIETAFSDKLITDTNTLIDISSNDKYMKSLANSLNTALRDFITLRNRFLLGDAELKNAVTNIAHDLRTPLTAICGYLNLLEEEKLSENAARYIMIIKNRTQILTELTEELFKYSVIITTEQIEDKETVIINEVLEESIAAFYNSLKEHGITPVINMTDKKITGKLNRPSLTRIFSNLLNNAIKYSDGDLDISILETGEIIFSNTASGLTQTQAGKLFDRFYTVEDARKSTGLGLSIAKTLVEQMGGNISACYKDNRLSISILFQP